MSHLPARRRALRLATVLSLAATATALGAAPAFAHVTAQPGDAAQGSYSVFSLRVPNESDTAATMTKTALTPPVQVGERTVSEAVRTVTWTANPGTRIGPGEFLEFPLSVGLLPTGVEKIALPAVQTYDDGEVVAWDQPMNLDGSGPERPAPTLTLTPATGDEHGGAGPPDATAQELGAADGTDSTARWLAGAGLLVGALGLGVGGGAVLRTRRTTAPEGTTEAPEREHSEARR